MEQYYNIDHIWINEQEIQNQDWQIRYIQSFYWSTSTVMLIGAAGRTNYEILFQTITLFVTVGIFAYVLEMISQILTQLSKDSIQYKSNLETINKYMKGKNLDIDTQTTVRKYLEMCYQSSRDFSINQEAEKVIDQLPTNLKAKVRNEINSSLLNQFVIFSRNFSKKSIEKVFYSQEAMIETSYVAQEMIFKQQTHQQDIYLYLILTGEVEIFYHNQIESITQIYPVKILKPGQIFNEDNFFTDNVPQYSARSTKFSNICKIKRSAFIQILKSNQRDFEKFCLIKDQLIRGIDIIEYKRQCFICNSYLHNENNCQLLQYKPNSYQVLLKNKLLSKQQVQKRQKYYRPYKEFRFPSWFLIATLKLLNKHFRKKYPELRIQYDFEKISEIKNSSEKQKKQQLWENKKNDLLFNNHNNSNVSKSQFQKQKHRKNQYTYNNSINTENQSFMSNVSSMTESLSDSSENCSSSISDQCDYLNKSTIDLKSVIQQSHEYKLFKDTSANIVINKNNNQQYNKSNSSEQKQNDQQQYQSFLGLLRQKGSSINQPSLSKQSSLQKKQQQQILQNDLDQEKTKNEQPGILQYIQQQSLKEYQNNCNQDDDNSNKNINNFANDIKSYKTVNSPNNIQNQKQQININNSQLNNPNTLNISLNIQKKRSQTSAVGRKKHDHNNQKYLIQNINNPQQKPLITNKKVLSFANKLKQFYSKGNLHYKRKSQQNSKNIVESFTQIEQEQNQIINASNIDNSEKIQIQELMQNIKNQSLFFDMDLQNNFEFYFPKFNLSYSLEFINRINHQGLAYYQIKKIMSTAKLISKRKQTYHKVDINNNNSLQQDQDSQNQSQDTNNNKEKNDNNSITEIDKEESIQDA